MCRFHRRDRTSRRFARIVAIWRVGTASRRFWRDRSLPHRHRTFADRVLRLRAALSGAIHRRRLRRVQSALRRAAGRLGHLPRRGKPGCPFECLPGSRPLDGPVGVTPVARWHVLGDRGVPVVAAGAQMSGNPLALQKDLDGSRSQSHLHLAARKAVWHAVEMTFELDVVVDTNPADAPFGKTIGLRRQRVEVGPVELFEQRPAGDTEPPDQAFVVELPLQLTDRRVEFGQTVEAAVAQAAEQPSLDDQHRDFDFRLVTRPARPCWQARGRVDTVRAPEKRPYGIEPQCAHGTGSASSAFPERAWPAPIPHRAMPPYPASISSSTTKHGGRG